MFHILVKAEKKILKIFLQRKVKKKKQIFKVAVNNLT